MDHKIRVGIIRCDGHALWYGALMAEHDPLCLQRPVEYRRGEMSHSWQGGGVHRFFYGSYGDPTEMTVPFVGGFEIVKVWDPEPHVAEQTKRVFLDVPKVCETPEECSDDVDLVLIANCNLDGQDHLELALPGLEKGVPTFIDKPLAYTVAECRKLLEAAGTSGAPLFSASILRFEPTVARFRDRISEVGAVNFASISGRGEAPAGMVHWISTVQHLFGAGIRTVQVMKNPKQTAVWLDYDNNPNAPEHGTMIHAHTGVRRFPSAVGASILGSRDDIHILVPGGYVYGEGAGEVLKKVQRMLQTRESPAELADMIEAIAVMEAIRKAENASGPVQVEGIPVAV